MINDLIVSIGKQLNIPKSDDNEWLCRVVYSVAGQMALASLWDHSEDGSSVSIQHFKGRIAQIFDAYEDIYPEIGLKLPPNKTDLIENIYSIYLRSGSFYHSTYQISPAAHVEAGYGEIVLHRGNLSDEKVYMSGLGFYSMREPTSDGTVLAMFDMQEQPPEDYLAELLGHCEWEPVDWPDSAEFLRLAPSFKRGYWQQMPDKDGRISLARYGEPNKIFAFYRFANGMYQQKAIPEWRIRDCSSNDMGNYGEYRRIAIALLRQYGTLPKIKAKENGDLIEIKLGYRLPPSEENFFMLYSWPIRYDFTEKEPSVFTRVMAKQVYPVFKHGLESLGYCFVEE